MIVFVLIAIFVLFVIGGVISLDNDRFSPTEKEKRLFIIGRIIWISQVIIAVIIITFSAIMWKKTATEMFSHEFEITAISDNHELYIIPRLWSSEGDTEVRYYFMRPNNGGFKQGYVPSDRSIIYETNDETPHIECYYTERIDSEKHPFLNIWFLQSDWDETDEYYKEYHIYIPKGSVANEYNIDLE
jgi:hypothetical protein